MPPKSTKTTQTSAPFDPRVDGIRWTPKLLRRVYPFRATAKVRKFKFQELNERLWKNNRNLMLQFQEQSFAQCTPEAAPRRARLKAAWKTEQVPADVLDAAEFHTFIGKDDWPALVDFWVSGGGPRYALDVLLAVFDHLNPRAPGRYEGDYSGLDAWYRLREHVVALKDPDYQPYLTRVQELLPALPLRQKSMVICTIPDETELCDQVATYILDLPIHNTQPVWLRLPFLCRISPKLVMPLAEVQTRYAEDAVDPIPTLMHVHGMLGARAGMRYTAGVLFKARERLVELFAEVFSQEATDYILGDWVYGRDTMAARVKEDPERSIRTLIRMVQAVRRATSYDKEDRPLTTRPHYDMLLGAVRANPGLTESLAEELGGESEEILLGILESVRPEAPEALLTELPALLQEPTTCVLPGWLNPAAFRAPKLTDGRLLPAAATLTLTGLLWQHRVTVELKKHLDTKALARFGWDILTAYVRAKGPPEDRDALTLQIQTLDDAHALKLAGELRWWVVISQHSRAVGGLGVLERLGTDAAMMGIDRVARAKKMPQAIQYEAQRAIQRLAQNRGLAPEDLADRLVPTLGLEDGDTLSINNHSYKIAFDEQLRPGVITPDGQFVRELPAGEGDAEARERFAGLKTESAAAAKDQLSRLETALASERSWSVPNFQAMFLAHPWLIFLARKLLWGVWEKDKLVASFRIAEDRSLADIHDTPYALGSPALQIRLLHPLHLDTAQQHTWQGILDDYKIIPPFPQLQRKTFTLTEEEKSQSSLARMVGKTLPPGKLIALQGTRWHRDHAEAGGVYRSWRMATGGGFIWLYVDPGLSVLDKSGPQTIERFEFPHHHFGKLSPVEISELLLPFG